MPSNNSRRRSRSPELRKALERMKWETAYEVGTPTGLIQGEDWGNVSSRDCGILGGEMVRKMVEAAQASLVATTSAGVVHGFQEIVGGPGNLSASATSAWKHPPGWHLDSDNKWHLGDTDQYATSPPNQNWLQNQPVNPS